MRNERSTISAYSLKYYAKLFKCNIINSLSPIALKIRCKNGSAVEQICLGICS